MPNSGTVALGEQFVSGRASAQVYKRSQVCSLFKKCGIFPQNLSKAWGSLPSRVFVTRRWCNSLLWSTVDSNRFHRIHCFILSFVTVEFSVKCFIQSFIAFRWSYVRLLIDSEVTWFLAVQNLDVARNTLRQGRNTAAEGFVVRSWGLISDLTISIYRR